MPSRYRSKVYVITGASDGIGAELALQLAERGHRLVLAARDEARLQAVAGQCQRHGAMAIAVRADVTVEDDCRRLIDRALEAFGRIDVLVNNAGVSMHATFDEIGDWSTYERLWRVNCLGTVNCTRFAWPYLKAAPGKRGGQIVGVSSLAGRTGVPGRTTYCASKFAQTGFLEALRIEAAEHGITVTVVAWWPPGSGGTAWMARARRPASRGSTRLARCRSTSARVRSCARSRTAGGSW